MNEGFAAADGDPAPQRVQATIHVRLGPRGYPIALRADARGFGAFAWSALKPNRPTSALVVHDTNVAFCLHDYVRELEEHGFQVRAATVPPGEGSKSLARCATLYDALLDMGADRSSVVVALGGGVIGDLAGFVAASYMRGIALLMVPTSLLAQVDSSVGGKVGVNYRHKNIVGAFHQPAGVWTDLSLLDRLPERDFRSGLGEVVRCSFSLERSLFESLEVRADDVLRRDPATLLPVVERCCTVKAGIVEADERESTGQRALLNAGHTIGHAIEAASSFDGRFLHGEAVAIGLLAEARLSERIGLASPATTGRLEQLLGRLRLPTRAPGLDPLAMRNAIDHDKKNLGGRLTFALMCAIGEPRLLRDVPEEILMGILGELV